MVSTAACPTDADSCAESSWCRRANVIGYLLQRNTGIAQKRGAAVVWRSMMRPVEVGKIRPRSVQGSAYLRSSFGRAL
jgi:hypothetical protein